MLTYDEMWVSSWQFSEVFTQCLSLDYWYISNAITDGEAATCDHFAMFCAMPF